MFRIWGKEMKDNRMIRDIVICDETDDTRTHKIFHALDQICYEFDLSVPILLQSSLKKSKASPYRATENRRNRHLPASSIFIYHILPFYKMQKCTIEIHQISCISFISYHKIQKKTREIARILQFCKRKCIFSWCDSGFTHI